MINTHYLNLERNFDSKRLASEETRRTSRNKNVSEKSTANKTANDLQDVAVTLTLSSQSSNSLIAPASASVVTTKAAATTPTLKVGSTGSAVKTLQTNLTKLGYSTKGTDGIFGNDTKNAVISFQKAYGLTADGIVGTQTQQKINQALDYYNKGILAVGSRGTAVKTLQTNLTKLGYSTKGTDGIFGNDTKKAVIAFQKAHGLTQDGIVGTATKSAIDKALKSSSSSTTVKPGSNTSATVKRMLNNLTNDTSLGLSKDKKTAMVMAAERLLNDGYEVAFVAGVLGNIQNEGTAGLFESSSYVSNPSAKPSYLVYMDEELDYNTKFSGKSISEVGISAAVALQKKAAASGKGMFGFGMIQWTGSRTAGVLAAYQKYIKHDKPTKDECIMAEVNFMADELKSSEFAGVYTSWKNGNKTASSAGSIVCTQYERPADKTTQANLRAQNATKIYNVMMK